MTARVEELESDLMRARQDADIAHTGRWKVCSEIEKYLIPSRMEDAEDDDN